MTTARDICNTILRKLHVKGRGQVIPNDELNDVLESVNDMLATWSVEGSLVYTKSEDTFSLSEGQESYTVGTGQDFNTSRILHVTSAYTSQGQTDYPLQEYSQEQYAYIRDKNITGIPEVFYYDGDFPTATMKLSPAPAVLPASRLTA